MIDLDLRHFTPELPRGVVGHESAILPLIRVALLVHVRLGEEPLLILICLGANFKWC